jgi:hypothetical protein
MPTTAPSTLTYAPPLSPTEFDHEFESERVRWLRRRLIIFCLVGIALAALWMTIILRGAAVRARMHYGDPLRVAGAGFDMLCYTVGIGVALVLKLNRRAIPLLALVLSATVGAFDVLQDRLAAQYDLAGGTALARELWSVAVPFNVIFDHLVPCLIIPWTLLECLIPAAAILGTAALVIAYDTAAGHGGTREAIPLIPALIAIVPGALVCWLRFSKFRRLFKLRFESGRYQQLQTELGGARRLLEACLPPPLDRGPVRFDYAYEPMRQIGGDLLFIHPPLDGSGEPPPPGRMLSAIVLDVTGHGIAAALTVSRFVGELERLFAERPDASPADVLRDLNHYVLLTLARHSIFVTAICLRLDSARGELEWASGGHPAAFLCHTRHDDGSPRGAPRIEPLECTAPMLGILDGDAFELETCRRPFAPGDVVVAYTDGASEAADPQGNQLGIRGVEAFIRQAADTLDVPPREWPNRLLRGVTAHRQAPPRDDTLLVALYRPTAETSGTR